MSFIIRAFFILFIIRLSASAYDFHWVTTFPGNSSANAIALDAQTNSFVAGPFSGTVNFGTNQLTSAGDSDVFIAKLNPTGSVLWVTQAGGNNADTAVAMATAPNGTLFVSGSFAGTAAFGSLSLTNTNSVPEGFLARLDANGQFQWVRRITNSGAPFVAVVPTASRVWLACPGVPLIRGYDFAGTNLLNFTVSTDASVSGLAVDVQDNIYLNGTFTSAANFGNTNLTGPGNGALYTAKVGPNGVVQWATTLNDSHRQEGHGVALSPDGAVISSGRIDLPHLAASDPTIVVMKNSADGALLWSQYYGFTRTVLTADALALDKEGNPHTVGHNQDPFTNFDPRQGTPIIAWTATGALAHASRIMGAATGQDSFGHGLAIDANGNLYIAGHFNGTALFGNSSITAAPPGASSNAYIAKFGAVMHPPLTVRRATNAVTLSWPSTAVGFRLQQSTNFVSTTWSNAPGFPITASNRSQLILPATDPRGFFRLATP